MTQNPVLITGGAGFIGSNLAHRLLRCGVPVTILDNLSRPGVRHNLDWLRAGPGGGDLLRVEVGDVRDPAAVRSAVRDAGFVFHLAGQVAVTTSLADPRTDFDINAGGTLTILEELRSHSNPPGILYTSTNKVYGALGDVSLHAHWNRYEPDDREVATSGISEQRPLAAYTPYGCSKAAADSYVLDYGRSFGIPAVVFRMSCIYGPRQFGTEDQGWLAHFLIQALRGNPITIFGDGRQVRDVLFVDDLVDAMLLARERARQMGAQAFNIGGGVRNTLSLVELLQLIRHHCGRSPDVAFSAWRTGDQRYYVSDISAFRRATGWSPRVNVENGVAKLHAWLAEQQHSGQTLELAEIAQ